MRTVGIIAEYDPFHRGHEYQIKYARETLGADHVVIAMSGDFVQRGMPALLSKYQRAEMALLCGADLVLEMPVSISTSSAEHFASGGVQLLDALGVVELLCFGSETGETEALFSLASVLAAEPQAYRRKLQLLLRQGESFPAARSRALLEYLSSSAPEASGDGRLAELSAEQVKQLLSTPNNILGIEYCKALIRRQSSIRPAALKRRGSGYHEEGLFQDRFPSASAIRRCVLSGRKDRPSARSLPEGRLQTALKGQLPVPSEKLLLRAVHRNAFLTPEDLDPLLRYRLLLETPESLCRFLDLPESLAQRICSRREEFQSFRQFSGLLKTKEITRTRIQRALLHMLLNISETPYRIPYARILGFRRQSVSLLSEIKKRSAVPLLTKLADAPRLLDEDGLSLLEETAFASNLYQSLTAQKTGQKFVHEYRMPVIVR